MDSKDLWVELKPTEPGYMVLKGTYGEKIHRTFRMTRQGVRWRFNRLFNHVYVEAFETIMSLEKIFGTQLRDYAVRISLSWFPHLQVLVDGKPIHNVYRSAMDFLVIPFPEGEHRVEIRAVLSPLRRFCLAVSALFSGVWIVLLFKWTFRSREEKP